MAPETRRKAPRRPRRGPLIISILAAVALTVVAAPAPASATGTTCRPAKIMTANLYLGADVRAAFVPQTQQELLQAATRVAFEVAATDFPRRAKTIADRVKATAPDLIGVQEAVIWRTQFPGDFLATPATRVRYDFLAILQRELALRGMHYAPVATVSNADFEVPTLLGFDLRLTDRDVILARTDLPAGTLQVAKSGEANFAANFTVPNPFFPVQIRRGWVAVDAVLEGCPFRLISTHLEGADVELVQQAQADELLRTGGPADVPGPLVLVGDFNSRADGSGTPTYAALINAGFSDAWSQVRSDTGNTCCHDVAALLRDPFDGLDGRIDLILTRGGPRAIGAQRLGVSFAEWLRRGIWPSDHAAVVATLALQ